MKILMDNKKNNIINSGDKINDCKFLYPLETILKFQFFIFPTIVFLFNICITQKIQK